MSWNEPNSGRLVLAGFAMMLAAGAAQAATLVVRSTGPSAKLYPPGKSLPENAKLVLKPNDTLVLLDAKGTRTLSGPGTFNPSAASTGSAGVGTTLAALAGGGGARRARIGAVRGAATSSPAKNPNVWFVDATRSATVCVADPAAITLWRPSTDAATATISGAGRTEAAMFVRGQNTRAWPAALPVTDGAEYKVAWPGQTAPTTLRFALVGAAPTDMETTAATLIKRGCQAQLDMLIETVAVPAGKTAG